MKVICTFLFSFSVCIFLYCCAGQTSKRVLPVIDLENPESTGKLKISEVLDHVRLIRLETRPEVLLPGFFYAWIGDKYIVTISMEEIHLFDDNGKYIRKVAQQGRGPEEFLYVVGYCVDEQRDRLYLSDGDSRICVIDLNEGKILQKIPVKCASPHKLLLTGQDTLIYIPLSMVKNKEYYDICRIKTDGTFIDGIRGMKSKDVSGMPYLGELNDTIYYKMGFCDTLFQVKDMMKIPYCCVVTDRPYSVEMGEGKAVDLMFGNKELFILADTEMKVETEGENIYSAVNVLGYYMFRKSDFKVRKITDFYLDILDYTYSGHFPILTAGKRGYRNINVSQFKEMLENKLDSPLIADSLKMLYYELSEDDNSLLLVGDIKE